MTRISSVFQTTVLARSTDGMMFLPAHHFRQNLRVERNVSIFRSSFVVLNNRKGFLPTQFGDIILGCIEKLNKLNVYSAEA